MNLEGVIISSRLKILSHKTIPLLALIEQWSAQREEAMMDTKCILYVLQTLQKVMCKHETDLTLELMLRDIKAIFSCSKYKEYIMVLNNICTNLSTFIGLFEHLNSLVSSTETKPLIDEKNGVIGGFIRFCLQEYQKMTFSQTVSLQKQWKQFYGNPDCSTESLKIRKKSNREHIAEAKQNKEYTIAMEKLLLPSLQSKTTGNVSVELKALHLAMLLTQFDHIDECKVVLKEAIRMAQLSKNTPVLEHSLALLQRLTTVHPSTSKPMIVQLITNANKNKENLLVSTGKLQLSKVEIQLDSDPKRVLDVLLSSEFDVFTCYDDYNHKSAVRSSALLLRASVFRQYGLRYLAALPLQLLCHMTKSKNDHTQHRTLDESKAICLIALILSEEGRFDEAIKMIETGLCLYQDTKVDTKFLHHCLAELNIQKLFNEGAFFSCQKFLNNLAVYDPAYARYWNLKLLIYSEQLTNAIELCNKELVRLSYKDRSQIKHDDCIFRARYLLALVEIFYKERLYSRAMEVALECLSFSKKHQLWEFVTSIKLKIATLQLQLCLISQSKNTIKDVLPVIMSHGLTNEKPLAFFILAEICLLENKEQFVANRKFVRSDISRALCYLDLSLQEVHTPLLTSPIIKKIISLKCLLESHAAC